MSRSTIIMDAAPHVVYGVLADPPSYEIWVVGNIDPGLRQVVARARQRLPPQGRLWAPRHQGQDRGAGGRSVPSARHGSAGPPLHPGHGFVTLRAEGSGTSVTMEERPRGDPWETVWNPLFDTAVGLRNAETLRRLKRLAEVRAGAVHH